ncbi:ATPase, T2SS/T4P/T4SS family [Vibrio mediterranei]|uniref:ATPase, T2SS/T4P/T4SS family n=1 Tax=Vibrio mediterranei TaxID=689 RepID=UPI0038CF02BE
MSNYSDDLDFSFADELTIDGEFQEVESKDLKDNEDPMVAEIRDQRSSINIPQLMAEVDPVLFGKCKDETSGRFIGIPLKTGEIYTSMQVFQTDSFVFLSDLKKAAEQQGLPNPNYKFIDQELLESLCKQIEDDRGETVNFAQEGGKETQAKKAFLNLIQKGYDYNATDAHFFLTDRLYVYYRVDKLMREDLTERRSHDLGLRAITQAVNMNAGGGDLNFNEPQSISINTTILDSKTQKPIHIQLRGEKVPLDRPGLENCLNLFVRIIKTDIPRTMAQLNVDPPVQYAFKYAMNLPKGMVLVSGPTSSGKTTLLGASIWEFPRNKTMRTIEDPAELKLSEINPFISQVSRPREEWTEYLVSTLRQDPDAILLGETRTIEQADHLIEATLTGHLTISTLHSNDCVGILERLIDMGVDVAKLTADGLMALLVATRLVPKTCPLCALEFDELSDEKQEKILAIFSENEAKRLLFANRKHTPCSRSQNPESCSCNFGVKGMEGVTEFVKPNKPMMRYVKANGVNGLDSWLRERGWKGLRDVARYKMLKGTIDPLLVENEIQNIFHNIDEDVEFNDGHDFYNPSTQIGVQG